MTHLPYITSCCTRGVPRKPLTAVQAATVSYSNYHCRHVGQIHHLSLPVGHLLLPILRAESHQPPRHLVFQPRPVFLRHYHGCHLPPHQHVFQPSLPQALARLGLQPAPKCITTSSSGTPTAGVTSAAALNTTYVTSPYTGARNLRRRGS